MGRRLEEHAQEELIEYIRRLKKQKKFGLVWEDKPEKVVKECETKLPVLKEVDGKAIEKAPGGPTNIIIEGDNYHALSVLNYTHAGKIDVIYIDPPYNTGNKDFIYNDCYVDKEDTFRHSKWLSFMEKRLRLAKNLLADDGVIFISIDDNEQADLKLLCDSVFSDRRMGGVGNIIWLKKNSDTASGNLSKNHEYIVAFQSKDNVEYEKTATFKQSVIERNGKYYIDKGEPLGFGMLNINNRPRLGYSFYYNPKTNDLVPVMDQDIEIAKESNDYNEIYSDDEKLLTKGYIVIRPQKTRGLIKCWGTSIENVKKRIDNYTVFINRKNEYIVHQLKEVDEKDVLDKKKNPYIIIEKKYPMSSVIDGISSKSGTDDLYEVLGDKGFNNPKPLNLIKYLLGPCSGDGVILDFFAGSGTTGQAVMELNEEDGGHRQFILVTNNEANGKADAGAEGIAEKVTYPRIKTVITGIRPDGTKYSDGIPANLRYFKTDFVDKGKTTDDTREALITECSDMIRIRENAFEFVASAPEYRFYKNDKVFVPIIFDQFAIAETWELVEKLNTEKLPVHCYNFSYNRHANEEEIPEDTELKWTACSIPETVLEVYRKIFRKKEVKNNGA